MMRPILSKTCTLVLQPKLGILQESGGRTDGIFRCSFTRENFVAGEKDVFDLTKDWHLMFAEGAAINGKGMEYK